MEPKAVSTRRIWPVQAPTFDGATDMTEPIIGDPLRKLLEKIRTRVVVIGSVARGTRWPKDLDLLWDLDSEPSKYLIKGAIQSLGLNFESPIIGSWTFRDYGWMVEVIPMHYGPDYRAVRRRAHKEVICGIEFFVADPTDVPVPPIGPDKKWVTWRR